MIYKATDRWNDDHLEHRNHKYYIKVGDGPNARYFYSAQEYQAWTRGGRQPQKKPTNPLGFVNKLSNKVKTMRNQASANAMRKRQDAELARARAQQSENIRTAEQRKAKMTAARDKAKANAVQRAAGKESRQYNFLKAKNSAKTRSSRMEAAYKKRTAATAEQQRMKDSDYRRKKMVKSTINKAASTAKKFVNRTKKAAKTAYQNAAIAYTSPKGVATRKKIKKNARTTAKRTGTTAKRAYNSGRSFVKNLFKKRK